MERRIFLAFIVSSFSGLVRTTDLTLEPKATGEDVVYASYSKTKKLFPDDHQFLIRVALVETNFGEDEDTFPEDYFGGIWKISKTSFENTQNNPDLAPRYKLIQEEFNIDWNSVEWEDLTKPMYSLLAAQLKLVRTGKKIPQNIEDQARFWKIAYSDDDIVRNRQDFLDDVRKLEDCSSSKVKCRIDLVIVLDGSGSIGEADFDKAKRFVIDLLDCIPSDTTNTGLLVYSEEVDTIFDLDSDISLTVDQKKDRVMSARYPGMGTNTHLGMRKATDWLISRQENNDDGTPPVMIVLTDGQSSVPTETRIAANYAKGLGISTFAIGVGKYVRRPELRQISVQFNENNGKVMQINSYKTLSDLLARIHEGVCETARSLKREVRLRENVGRNEVSYYAYRVPKTGIKVSVETPLGKTKGFYSYKSHTPSSAFNDGVLTEGSNFIPPPHNNNSTGHHHDHGKRRWKRNTHHRHWHHYIGMQVYIAIEGVQEVNNFTIEVQDLPIQPVTRTTPTEVLLASLGNSGRSNAVMDEMDRNISISVVDVPSNLEDISAIKEPTPKPGLERKTVYDISSEIKRSDTEESGETTSASVRLLAINNYLVGVLSLCVWISLKS